MFRYNPLEESEEGSKELLERMEREFADKVDEAERNYGPER